MEDDTIEQYLTEEPEWPTQTDLIRQEDYQRREDTRYE